MRLRPQDAVLHVARHRHGIAATRAQHGGDRTSSPPRHWPPAPTSGPLEDAPPPGDVEDAPKAPLELAYPAARPIGPRPHPRRARAACSAWPAFLADTKLYAALPHGLPPHGAQRSDDLSEAWAMGGSVHYRSGWLAEPLRRRDRGVRLAAHRRARAVATERSLLGPDQSGYAVLGVANGMLRYRRLRAEGIPPEARPPLREPPRQPDDPEHLRGAQAREGAGPAEARGRLRLADQGAQQRHVRLDERSAPASTRSAAPRSGASPGCRATPFTRARRATSCPTCPRDRLRRRPTTRSRPRPRAWGVRFDAQVDQPEHDRRRPARDGALPHLEYRPPRGRQLARSPLASRLLGDGPSPAHRDVLRVEPELHQLDAAHLQSR